MLVTISGVSGSGKSSVMLYLVDKFDFQLVPSWTTRQKRQDDKISNTYIFISHAEFKKMKAADEFILVDKISDNLYGTRRQDLYDAITRKSNKSVVDFTSKSVNDMIKMNILPTISIFLFVQLEESISRMQKRGDSHKSLDERKEFYFRELVHGVELATLNRELIFINSSRNKKDVFNDVDQILNQKLGKNT